MTTPPGDLSDHTHKLVWLYGYKSNVLMTTTSWTYQWLWMHQWPYRHTHGSMEIPMVLQPSHIPVLWLHLRHKKFLFNANFLLQKVLEPPDLTGNESTPDIHTGTSGQDINKQKWQYMSSVMNAVIMCHIHPLRNRNEREKTNNSA